MQKTKMKMNLFELDRTHIETGSFEDFDDTFSDIEFWMSRSPIERMQGIEFLRQSCFNYDPVSERLQRVFDIVE